MQRYTFEFTLLVNVVGLGDMDRYGWKAYVTIIQYFFTHK